MWYDANVVGSYTESGHNLYYSVIAQEQEHSVLKPAHAWEIPSPLVITINRHNCDMMLMYVVVSYTESGHNLYYNVIF